MKSAYLITATSDANFSIFNSKVYLGYAKPGEQGILEDYFNRIYPGYNISEPFLIDVEDEFNNFTLQSPKFGLSYSIDPSKN